MRPQDRILVVLDVPRLDAAQALAQQVAPAVGGFKVGLELLTSVGAPTVVAAFRDAGRPLFFDAKFCDIPNTVAGAVRAAAQLGVAMLNVHALGGTAMMRAAVAAAREGAAAGDVPVPKVLAVTILTSLNAAALRELGWRTPDVASVQAVVVRLAQVAQAAGCDGVVASPQEITAIRQACGPEFLIVTPGVRPHWAAAGDQQRVLSPREAIAAGADYLVIGRPITQPPPSVGSPRAAVQRIVEELA